MSHKEGDIVYIKNLTERWESGEEFIWTGTLLSYLNKRGQIVRIDSHDNSCRVKFENDRSYWFPASVLGTTIEVLLKCEDFTETVEMSRELYDLIISKKPISITSYE